MISIIDFVRMFEIEHNGHTKIVFIYEWIDDGIDEEYCFEGNPTEFLEKYTKDYTCLNGFDIDELSYLLIMNDGNIEINMKLEVYY